MPLAWLANLLVPSSNAMNSTTPAYTDGCSINAVMANPMFFPARSLLFGVADTATDAARLRSVSTAGYKVRVAFTKDIVLAPTTVRLCSSPST